MKREYSPEVAAKRIRSAHALGPVYTEDAKALGKEGWPGRGKGRKLTEQHKAKIAAAHRGNQYARSGD